MASSRAAQASWRHPSARQARSEPGWCAGRAAVPYAGVIHFGWAAHSIAPQPFLYDAADSRADEVLAKFHEDINKQARSAGLDVSTGGITA